MPGQLGRICHEGPLPQRHLLLQWHITERCNLRCAHCYQEANPEKELPFRQLLEVLRQFEILLGELRRKASPSRVPGHISVTGGEPFVRSDFADLLQVLAAKRTSFSFSILTNGSFIDSAMARRLCGLRPAFVQVSIEGSQTTHDSIRGAGDFERTVEALKHLVRERVRTFISFTAHRINFWEFPEVARLGRKLRVSRVWADRLIPLGRGSKLREQVLTPCETRQFFELIQVARREAHRWWPSRTEIAMHRALQFLVGGGEPYHCTAGDTLIAVQSNGDLCPCRRMPIPVGNVLETPLLELYETSPLLRALRGREWVGEGCQECFYSRLCRGGLRCLSYALRGDPFHPDPGCWRTSTEGTRPADATVCLGPSKAHKNVGLETTVAR